jgi:hypothetical protein
MPQCSMVRSQRRRGARERGQGFGGGVPVWGGERAARDHALSGWLLSGAGTGHQVLVRRAKEARQTSSSRTGETMHTRTIAKSAS